MGWRDQIAKALTGIKAFHSSPHDFDRFDLSKIGTGEGAQVYGHGIYAAENPAVSGRGGEYWQQFLSHPALSEAEQHAGGRLRAEGFDKEKAIAATQRDVNDWLEATQPADYAAQMRGGSTSYYDRAHAQKMLALRQGELEALVSGKAGPRTYELNIKADPAQMLDWDKPLKEQAVGDTVARMLEKRMIVPDENMRGVNAYGELGTHYDQLFSRPQNLNADQAASTALQRAGIPGIKYLDQHSRDLLAKPYAVEHVSGDVANRSTFRTQEDADRHLRSFLGAYPEQAGNYSIVKPQGTSNYVVFDPSIIDITKKYAVPGAIGAGAMGSLASQDQYGVAQ